MEHLTGAQLIARSLHDIGVTVIFGIVGIPVVEIAEEAINLGIRFIAFRNEQACSYAASAYGYITGRPGICLVVGGPGVLHAMAGIGNASANAFPLVVLAGSAETTSVTKGGFQEMDAISLLTPHTKFAVRPPSLGAVGGAVRDAYRMCWYGRPGPAFVDLPADLIQAKSTRPPFSVSTVQRLPPPPKSSANPEMVLKVAEILKLARAPLVVIGKGSAYARAEVSICKFIEQTQIPFLPTPMGKGVVPDTHRLNTSSARSTALKHADVVLLLGARLNWILHFGEEPRWSSSARIIQVDIHAEEVGRNAGDAELGLVGDVDLVVEQLLAALANWQYRSPSASPSQSYKSLLKVSSIKNENNSRRQALQRTPANGFLTFQRAFHIIRTVFNSLCSAEEGDIVYVSEGANTMDISRSLFQLEHPRQRLDAGTYATMGVGLGYIVAAHAAYNLSSTGENLQKQKKIVAFEGDSAFGFSAMEIETLARQQIPALIFVMNNSGIYHGDTKTEEEWRKLQKETFTNQIRCSGISNGPSFQTKKGLRSTSLLYNTRYEYLAAMCGGKGFFARTEEELEKAAREGFLENEKVVIVNVIVDPGIGQSIQFGWQTSNDKGSQGMKL
uniref:2-hydroxyacyl-CoA lyase n=1 Tax=Coccidioides posadasii RMSCC 3488 TaxID=454284 RepID=A0A0J6FK46_COCPO|nr:2-hydroxyphytanoyl-CoA lyase [Coccidioides posadasii RMSCC 3488]